MGGNIQAVDLLTNASDYNEAHLEKSASNQNAMRQDGSVQGKAERKKITD